ncbi:hypothetical protein E1B28_012298 [Marasmius oreades]|uniref:BTB domain-containing protein n=1 Tax=Marasmius oreades TaxID=181124 RepID=A0A9P7RR69_9AGAR|nr:uncharacterized protein E1B28_012298 [Marasmius oreades]KAG7088286.1 hypothetical protein E1B28_012298 [Marasmius oreades]
MDDVVYQRGDPWFSDGNIILVTNDQKSPIAFRVHKGVLSRHSEVFQGMFEMPQPQSVFDAPEDCQVVPMHDLSVELSILVKALYDGPSFANRSIDDFFYLAGILRLSTKYCIGHLRTQAIHFLTETWCYTLRGHDNMVDLAVKTPSVNQMSYPFVHPIHVLNLARETNVRIVLPSVFYFLSLYPLNDLLRADHPKLLTKHPSKPSSELHPRDIKDYTLMFQRRLDLLMDFTRRICGERKPTEGCTNQKACIRHFTRATFRLERSWKMRTGVFYFMSDAMTEVLQDGTFCILCREAFQQEVTQYRQHAWNELPSVLGLPCWEDLINDEIPSGRIPSSTITLEQELQQV